MSPYWNAYAKVQKWIFPCLFPGNWFKFGIILNDFWSSTIWAIQIQLTCTEFKNPKNPGIQPIHALISYSNGASLQCSVNELTFPLPTMSLFLPLVVSILVFLLRQVLHLHLFPLQTSFHLAIPSNAKIFHFRQWSGQLAGRMIYIFVVTTILSSENLPKMSCYYKNQSNFG